MANEEQTETAKRDHHATEMILMEQRPSLPAPFKKPPIGGAHEVCTYSILNSLLEIPMAVTFARCATSKIKRQNRSLGC
jgi:hypothetical protein